MLVQFLLAVAKKDASLCFTPARSLGAASSVQRGLQKCKSCEDQSPLLELAHFEGVCKKGMLKFVLFSTGLQENPYC